MSDSSTTPTTESDAERNFAALRATQEATARENAFLRAGVDVDSPQGKLLMKGYEGALESDAIKAYRDEIFPPAPAGTTTQQQEQGNPDPYATEVAGQQAVRDSLASGQPGQQEIEKPDVNTYDDAMEHFHTDRKAGVPNETAQLAAIDRVIAAAASGKTDVLLDPDDWAARKAEAGHKPKAMQDS